MDDKSFHFRIPKKWVRVSLIVATTALVVAPLTAIASHTFTDVSDSNTFHADIDWLASAGITKGCNPPTNDEFCPNDSVTRGQMSAFMRRFAKFIDAEDGTPGQADSATTADNATTAASADDADNLGGSGPDAYQSRAGGVLVDATHSGPPTALATITGFTVPENGGVLVVSADDTFVADSGPQLGVIWIEVDGSGACDGTLVNFAWFETISAPFENASTSTSHAVGSGDHRIDLCAAGLALATTDVLGSLTAQWSEKAEGSTITSASAGRSLDEVLSDLRSRAGDLLES